MPSEFRTPLIVGGAVIGVCAIVAAAAVLTPEPAPTTTYETAQGEEVTVSWEDYPAHAGTAAEDALAAPAESEIADRWASLQNGIETRLTPWDLDFAPVSEEGWHPELGNGYGGDSRLVHYNSEEQVATGIPRREDWPEVIELVDEVLADHGIAPLRLDGVDGQDDSWLIEQHGSTDPDEWSTRSGWAYSDGEWLSMTIWDDALFPGDGEPETDALRGPHGVSFSYGATTVADDERAAFEREIEPFRGLEPPFGTTSD